MMDSVYERLGVRTYINAAGHETRHGGSLMPPEVLAAMQGAAQRHVWLPELQAARPASGRSGGRAGGPDHVRRRRRHLARRGRLPDGHRWGEGAGPAPDAAGGEEPGAGLASAPAELPVPRDGGRRRRPGGAGAARRSGRPGGVRRGDQGGRRPGRGRPADDPRPGRAAGPDRRLGALRRRRQPVRERGRRAGAGRRGRGATAPRTRAAVARPGGDRRDGQRGQGHPRPTEQRPPRRAS